MELSDIGRSSAGVRDGARRALRRAISLARGFAGELDLVDITIIVGPAMVAAVVHGLSDLMTNYVEPERTLLRPRSTR